MFSHVGVFEFLCHCVGRRQEEGIKTAQELGLAGTPLDAVVEQLNIPLGHRAPLLIAASGLESRDVEYRHRLRDAFERDFAQRRGVDRVFDARDRFLICQRLPAFRLAA